MKNKPEVDNYLYTEIKGSSQARKDILTSAIDMIRLMKRYEKIKAVKSRKANILQELSVQLKHTHSLVSSFNSIMPKVSVKEPKVHIVEEKKMSKKEYHKEIKGHNEQFKVRPMPKEKLDSFEEEIQSIQNRLNQL